MASNKFELRIHFDGTEQKSLNGVKYTSWHYTVHDGKTHEYVNKYIRKIKSKHDFHLHVGMSGDRVVVNIVAGMYPE